MYDEIIVYNPHTCVISKVEDPNCDFRSREYANIISYYIPSVLITSDIPRYVCDNNRNRCRNSDSRNRLRPYIKPNNFILEVHSFTKLDNNWFDGKRVEPDIVLLSSNNRKIVKGIQKLLSPYYDVVILEGSPINDIQKEVNEKMSNGVLIELAYELKHSDITHIAKLLRGFFKE